MMRRRGFTLVEVLISLTLLGIIMGSLTSVVMRSQQRYTIERERARAWESVHATELLLTRLFRSAGSTPFIFPFVGVDPNPMSSGIFDNVRLRADFNPADSSLTGMLEDVLVRRANDTVFVRWKAGDPEVPFAYPIRELRFAYFTTLGTEVTTVNAQTTMVRITIVAVQPAGTTQPIRRVTWVNLRNR